MDDPVARALAIARAATGKTPLPPGTLSDSRAAAFESIHANSLWGRGQSTSGPGSEIQNAEAAVEALLQAVEHTGATSLLDVGCGDFLWLGAARAAGRLPSALRIMGIDISPSALDKARAMHSDVSFNVIDVASEPAPPGFDIAICRQCLNHMSAEHVLAALANIAASGCRYLLASHYPHGTNEQMDLSPAAGTTYRCYNLRAPPFDSGPLSSEPERMWMDEYDEQRRGSPEANPMHLALWRLAADGA